MASIGSLIIDLVAKTGAFETDMGRAAKTAEKRAKEIDRSFTRMGSRITGALAGLAAGFSLAKIIQATSDAEKALAALDNAVRNNAGAAGATTKQLADFSGELQRLTTFSDDSIQGMQALLLSFQQIGGTEFRRAQIAVLDLATALGKDLNSSALLVGRALADPVKGMTALARAGVVLSKEQQSVIKGLVESGRSAEAQGIILKQLESRYGGAAQAARNTFGGALAGLKNAFDDLLEVKSGLPGSIDAINEFTAVLQDPATSAGVDALTSGIITGFAAAAKGLAQFAGGIKLLAEDLAALQFGAAADDLVRLNEQLELAQNLRSAGPMSILKDGAFFDRLRFFGKDGLVEWYSDADLDREMKRLKGLIEQNTANTKSPLAGPGGTSSPATGPVAPPPATEEFTKLAARLNEQIALHGKVGEAAKLAYAIQSGALEELSESEEKQLMALARRADAVAAMTDAQKQAAEEQKKALADQQRAQESIVSMVSGLQQEIATFDQGETSVIRYRIAHGDLATQFALAGEGAQQMGADIISLTSKLELMKDTTESVGDAVSDFAAQNQSALDETLAGINLELEKRLELNKPNDEDLFAEQARDATFDSLKTGISSALTDGAKSGWDGFKAAGLRALNDLVATALAKKLLEGLFGEAAGGTGSGWIGALAGAFGGGRATGGPVTAGTMYRVNEREPEYFKPNIGGKVIPLSKMPSMGGDTFNIAFSGSGPPSMETRQQVMNTLGAAVAAARRRNG